MGTGDILLYAGLKILFVLAVVVGAFAPILVWAERRQSAMIQDRIGPHRAGIPLPKALVDMLRPTLRPLQLASSATMGLALVCLLLLALKAALGTETFLPDVTPADIVTKGLALVGLSILLRLGYFAHSSIVKNDGNLALLGLLHPLADALKMIFKEDFIPPKADKLLHALAPIITLMPAIAAFTVIPFADVLYVEAWDQVLPAEGAVAATAVPMQIASLNVGVLFVFAIAGTGIIGAAIGGYASDNKYSLLGGLRAAGQMVSYEVALGLTIVPCFMVYGSLQLDRMATWQADNWWGIFPQAETLWYPSLLVSFVLYVTAAIAETKRVPFDVPEGESELVGGYLTEYSGFKFGMFFMSEFVEVIALAAIAAFLFFGGWDVPFLYRDGLHVPEALAGLSIEHLGWTLPPVIEVTHWIVIAIQVGAVLVKISVLIWFQLMIRWSLPRFRYDQIMKLCWKGLLPLALANILVTGVVILLAQR